jgi:hypothetical protein
VFLSSDTNQVGAGDDWLNKERAALESCEVFLGLFDARSVQRHWVNFEAGAAWIQRRILIRVCYRTLSPPELPPPYLNQQAVEIPRQAKDLISALRTHLQVWTHPEADPRCEPVRDGDGSLQTHHV